MCTRKGEEWSKKCEMLNRVLFIFILHYIVIPAQAGIQLLKTT
jgi:hypothetical protein